MMRRSSLTLSLILVVVPALQSGAGSALAAPCTGPGAPTTTQTTCLTAVQIPGTPLRSFDISWVTPDRAEYYLADRSNAGIDIINTQYTKFKRRLGGFVGVILNTNGTVNNNLSGPDGVVTHGRWLYAGDGDSTLKVFDLNGHATAPAQAISTGGTTRVDEMALTTDGRTLVAANNAEDPPFATLFAANGDASKSATTIITKVTIDPAIVPPSFGLSIEQPAWEPRSARFYVSVPLIANNPTGCNYGQMPGPITCQGGMLVIDPTTLTIPAAVIGAFDPATNIGVVPLNQCAPNGLTVGPNANLLLGCTPANNPTNTTTLAISATTKNFANIGGITGSDEVWFNAGDDRFYTGSNRQPGGAVLGVISDASLLIETIPQSSASHSVAADSTRNRIFVPQAAPVAVVGAGGDTTAVGAGICGSTTGCVAVYFHDVRKDNDQ